MPPGDCILQKMLHKVRVFAKDERITKQQRVLLGWAHN